MFLIEDLATAVLWAFLTVVIINFLLLVFVFYRRLARKRYYAAKDDARERYRTAISQFVSGELAPEVAADILRGADSPPEQEAIQERLLAAVARPEDALRTTQLLIALGYVQTWLKEAFGRQRAQELAALPRASRPQIQPAQSHWTDAPRRIRMFAVPRALAVDYLGRLAPEYAHLYCSEALKDPSPVVRRVAVASMGRNRVAAAIPLLLEELVRAVEGGNDLSLREIKSALVFYQIEDLPYFSPLMNHPHPRMRFFVVDTIREICQRASKTLPLNKNDFSPEMYELFLERMVRDEFADVRARSAPVIRQFRDQRATEALRVLLRDENEFVRLHAARACADRFYAPLIPDLVRRVTDTKWRVREAATRTLIAFGRQGINELYRNFVKSTDLYMSEQTTEEIQRTGLTPDLVATLSSSAEEAPLAEEVCRKMARLGRTSLLTNALASPGIRPEARAALMEALMVNPTPQLKLVLEHIAQNDTGPLGEKAVSAMHRLSGIHNPPGGGNA